MELTFIIYIFAAFLFIPGTYFIMSKFGKSLAGGIAALGMLTFFILFGLEKYTPTGNLVQQEVITNWPPGINQCPDFLTLFLMPAVAASGSTAAVPAYYVCIDTIGVASQKNNSIVQYIPTKSSVLPGANQIFPLSTDLPTVVKQCRDTNVTWEGIWDGLQQYSNTIPPPPPI